VMTVMSLSVSPQTCLVSAYDTSADVVGLEVGRPAKEQFLFSSSQIPSEDLGSPNRVVFRTEISPLRAWHVFKSGSRKGETLLQRSTAMMRCSRTNLGPTVSPGDCAIA